MPDERDVLIARLEALKARAIERTAERDELRSITGALRGGSEPEAVRVPDAQRAPLASRVLDAQRATRDLAPIPREVEVMPMRRADTYDPPPAPEVVRPAKQDRSPRGTVKMAKERLQRASLAITRRLEDLTEEAIKGAPPCKTCGRGTPREEELRLKAIIAALDRAGVSAAASRDAGTGEVDAGPLLVFPPGTRIAVVAETPGGADGAPGAGLRPTTEGPRLTRADLY